MAGKKDRTKKRASDYTEAPGCGNRPTWEAITKARQFYAENPNCSLADAFRHAELPPQLGYQYSHTNQINTYPLEFEKYRREYQELQAGKTSERFVRLATARLHRHERLGSKIEERIDGAKTIHEVRELVSAHRDHVNTEQLMAGEPTEITKDLTKTDPQILREERLRCAKRIIELDEKETAGG
jgi:hypothetical protein